MTKVLAWIENVLVVAVFVALLMFACVGCEQPKEKVLDVETPAGGIEVERTPDGDEVDVKITEPNER